MNFFHLFAHGEAFDVDAFLAATTLKADYVWRRGDKKRYCPPEIDSRHPTSGVEFVLGDGRAILYPDQEEIALAFIAAGRDGLKALGEFPGVDQFILMFHYEREFDGEMVGGCVGASPRLMWHALDIGCRLDFTFVLRRAAEECEEIAAAEPGAAPDPAA